MTGPVSPPHRYRSADEDSARWDGFCFRPDDIVISSRSKHGTTWMQAIVAALVFGGPDLPAPMPHVSPWLDFLGEPMDSVRERLDQQDHRRFIKTHTPLDGLPQVLGVSYIVIARHPLDAAVSLWHQGSNIDRPRMAELMRQSAPTRGRESRPLREWLVDWIGSATEPRSDVDSLPGVMHHLTDAWRRRNDAGVTLVHYADLETELTSQLRRLAGFLSISVQEADWPRLTECVGFVQMRQRADVLAPDQGNILRSRQAFFRRGSSGAAREVLSCEEIARYEKRAASLAPPGLLRWLHR